MNLLNAGCGTHYAAGWVNTDVWVNEDTRPDVKVVPGKPYPFEDNTFDAVMLSHVLEHIEWGKLFPFLKDMQRIAKPNAPMLIICPDLYKTIHLWHQNQLPWWLVESVMEHQDLNPEQKEVHEWWDGATHHWNCHEERLERLLISAGFCNVQNVFNSIPSGNGWTDPEMSGIHWPVIGKADWQTCFRVTNP